ncbi:MAG: helix-turn-helix domain containing protein [Methanoregula sp.]|nr:helix-turn-helix domain containing protein [Methanoregula sp.]
MSRKGYRATTMDDIAEYIGVSKTTLYQYFRNKDDLVIEIVKAFPEEIREKTMSKFPAASRLDGWIAILDFYLENSVEENALFFEFLSMIPRNPEIAKSFSENMLSGLKKATLGVAKQQQQGKGGTGAAPRTIALAMMSLFNGLRALSLIGVERDELRAQWIEIGKILLGYKENS